MRWKLLLLQLTTGKFSLVLVGHVHIRPDIEILKVRQLYYVTVLPAIHINDPSRKQSFSKTLWSQ